MSVLAALIFLQAAPQAAEPAPDSDIVVLGQKLRNWKGTWRSRKGAISCRTTKSSGDRDVDAVSCQAFMVCLSPDAARIEMLMDGKGKRAVRQSALNDLFAGKKACFDEQHKRGIAALADRRAAQ